MAKSKASAVSSQVKSSLQQLRKLGLYNPKNARKAPTKYAKSLVKKYADVLGPKAKSEVIKIPKAAAAAIKAQDYRVVKGKKKAVAVVPKMGGMKASYNKKSGEIIRRAGDYTMRQYPDRFVFLSGGELPKLKRGERWAVRIGNSFRVFEDVEELRRAMAEYNPASTTLWQYPYVSKRK